MNKFYVYLHKRKDNDVVFYVGKGSGERLKHRRRHVLWNKVVQDAGGFNFQYYSENLTEEDALKLETELILNPNKDWQLINKRTSTNPNVISKDTLCEYFTYDTSSPTSLKWKKWNNSKIKKTSKKEGDIAGYIVSDGSGMKYYSVRVDGKSMLVHRIIWIMANGDIPKGLVINHKNGNSLDNSIENLECITQRENCHRTSKQRKTNSGTQKLIVGKHSYWVATWTNTDGTRGRKLFSCNKHGDKQALELALAARKSELERLNSEGSGYLILQN